MNTITVLLSTYNGQKYIREQLESLLIQEDVEVSIIVRDDGSKKDNTIEILNEYKEKFNGFTVLAEENIGAEQSFNRLCQYAIKQTNTDYYAFCDQDDYWLPNKLSKAVEKLSTYSSGVPNLYFSNLCLANENLEPYGMMFPHGLVHTDKRYALLQQFTYGCTCVFNRTALEYYTKVEDNVVFHDNWISVLCSYFGNVYYDDNSYIRYRQHGSNLSGDRKTNLRYILKKIKDFRSEGKDQMFWFMAIQLLNHYNDCLSIEDKEYLRLIVDYKNSLMSKVRLIISPTYKTWKPLKDMKICLRILINSL